MEMILNIAVRVVWTSTYTYILLFFVAAAFIAYISRPRGRGEVVKRLYAGELIGRPEAAENSNEPCLHIRCVGGGKVVFERLNVPNLTSTGAISLAVSFKGSDVEILERDTFGYPDDEPMNGARFTIDMTGYEWRHVKWSDEDSGLWCAFTLHVREGIEFRVALKY